MPSIDQGNQEIYALKCDGASLHRHVKWPSPMSIRQSQEVVLYGNGKIEPVVIPLELRFCEKGEREAVSQFW